MPGPGGTIILTDGDDAFPGVGDDNSGAEFIFARNGNDTVSGGALADTILGEGGDDQLLGGEGEDFLFGGDGNDAIEGGAGNDVISDDFGIVALLYGGEGDDRVQIANGFNEFSVASGDGGYDILQLGSTIALNLMKIRGFEELNYTSAVGTVTATAKQFAGFGLITVGGEVAIESVSLGLFGRAGRFYTLDLADALGNLSVFLLGTFGSDTLTTGKGADTVYGDRGNDSIAGGKGRDDLHGSAGNDTLTGGQGRDTLTGGGDDDTYAYLAAAESAPAATGDRIIGWFNGDDTIDLSAIDAVPGGADDAFAFIGTDPASSNGGEVQFDTTETGTDTIVYVYIDADAIADMRIVIQGVFNLTADDFVL